MTIERAGRTSRGGFGGLGGGGGLPIPMGGIGKLGLPGILIIVFVAFVLPRLTGGGGGLPIDLGGMQGLPAAVEPRQGEDPLAGAPASEAELVDFIVFVFTDVQTFWRGQFSTGGEQYADAKLRIFRSGTVESRCGTAPAEAGPFYCRLDRTVYVNPAFFSELDQRFGAPGDFAQAYVIAHEMGHHVQQISGIFDEADRLRGEKPDDAADISVRSELQADCLAGVWAHATYRSDQLDEGDREEALRAAASVGDDTIQQRSTGRVDPESFTHGSAEQRERWLRSGFDDGRTDSCDTFAADNL